MWCVMQRRPPLYYALEQRWGLEKLSWLVDKSVGTAYEKDLDGLSLVTHARKNACPEELVIRLAVAAASHCILALDELLHGHHCESARRFCHRALQDYFAGVPKFPHTHNAVKLLVCVESMTKTPAHQRTRVNSIELKSPEEVSSPDFTIFERDWAVLIPFLRDSKEVFEVPPPTPSLIERTNALLVLELTPILQSQHEERNDDRATRCEDERARIADEQRTFSPYFYVVEMATFSPTFWRRYDQTWWFDKTKTNVIDGMYKVVHRGFGTKVSISTSAYAGCVRVAWCSIDRFGDYSDPLLLPPLPDYNGDPLSDQLLTAPHSHSVEMKATMSRLQQLLDDLQLDNGTLSKVYGLPRYVRSVADAAATLLEAKVVLRSCNLELALLLSGYKTLEKQLRQIKLATGFYAKLLHPFLLVQCIIPALDGCPVESLPIIRRLHELLSEVHDVIVRLSAPGWLQYLLMDVWLLDALHKISSTLAMILASDDCALQCSRMGLEVSEDNCIPWTMKTARSYLLIAVGRLEEATDRATKLLICRELCNTLHLYPENIQGDDEEKLIALIADRFLTEFKSRASQQALEALRLQDSFEKHLVSVTTHDGEKSTRVPEAVHFDLDPYIRGVNRTGMHLVIRVSNVSLDSCAVQGKASFCERTGRLSFIPAAEFERNSHYRVSVREQEMLSSLGGHYRKDLLLLFTFQRHHETNKLLSS
ncbi:hypothetical protein GN244_ATG08694 [Phytophthora infestans]|uniref:Uncharacterized protein n=1 Tax=Phytophthora infestans TaxID=4787 RepID=A0A833W1Z1_PHYIN|nr:hypothetical protein GN244_ATG08694 [Phytophthora infestans]